MNLSRLAGPLRSLLVLAVAALAFAALPAAAAPAAQAAPPYLDAEWSGWGIAARFDGGAPSIKFAVYVGRSGSPPVVLGKLVEDITEDCDVLDAAGAPATLSIDSAGYADFDGNVYIRCDTPDWGDMVAKLAPHLAPASNPACECPPTLSPVWASADLILDPPAAAGGARSNMLLDARELGLTFALPTVAGVAQSQIGRSNGAVLSSTWLYDSTGGNRVLAGQHGPFDVAVIDAFGGLSYLTSPKWRPFFINSVRGGRVGQWLEPANTGTFVTAPSANFWLATDASTVYIGRNSATGELLQARVRVIHGDPGCYG